MAEIMNCRNLRAEPGENYMRITKHMETWSYILLINSIAPVGWMRE